MTDRTAIMNVMARRSYGTGQLYEKHGAYYGRWRDGSGGRFNRRVGSKRLQGSSTGLTRAQAERKLQAMIDGEGASKVVSDPARTVGSVGAAALAQLEVHGRRASTVEAFESGLRVHLVPYFGDLPIGRITHEDIERFMSHLRTKGLAPKSVKNYLSTLHSVFDYALRKRWIGENPCRLVTKPQTDDSDADIRFLTLDELDAVIRAIDDADLRGPVERVLYRVAAMTGMRQGELLGLRWQDVDWLVAKVRVRQSFVRGEFGKPKSKRSSRGVPLAMRVAAELESLHRLSAYKADADLVFAHPQTGRPLDRSKVLKRLKGHCRAAGVREIRFHDLRHTFGTTMAASGVPLRTLQEWMGHRDIKTTQIYADYCPGDHEADLVEQAFSRRGVQFGVQSEDNSDTLSTSHGAE